MTMVWFLAWCVGNVLHPLPNDGCLTEGPEDWKYQHTLKGEPFCAAGEGDCNTGATCEIAKKDILEKGLHHKVRVNAWCGTVCSDGGYYCH